MKNMNKPEESEEKKNIIAKGHERDLKGLKKLMEKRSEQRSLAYYFW